MQSGRGLRKKYFLEEITEEEFVKKAGLECLLEYLIDRSEKKGQSSPVFLQNKNLYQRNCIFLSRFLNGQPVVRVTICGYRWCHSAISIRQRFFNEKIISVDFWNYDHVGVPSVCGCAGLGTY